MKKYFISSLLALLTSTLSLCAIEHDMQKNGMAEAVYQVYEGAKDPQALAQIIQTYYGRLQDGKNDISIGDLQKLHDALVEVMQTSHKRAL